MRRMLAFFVILVSLFVVTLVGAWSLGHGLPETFVLAGKAYAAIVIVLGAMVAAGAAVDSLG